MKRLPPRRHTGKPQESSNPCSAVTRGFGSALVLSRNAPSSVETERTVLYLAVAMSALGHKRTSRLSLSFCHRSRDLACLLDEKLRDRTDGAILQGEDSHLHVSIWQVRRVKALISRPLSTKLSMEARNIERKRPVASMVSRTSCGYEMTVAGG